MSNDNELPRTLGFGPLADARRTVWAWCQQLVEDGEATEEEAKRLYRETMGDAESQSRPVLTERTHMLPPISYLFALATAVISAETGRPIPEGLTIHHLDHEDPTLVLTVNAGPDPHDKGGIEIAPYRVLIEQGGQPIGLLAPLPSDGAVRELEGDDPGEAEGRLVDRLEAALLEVDPDEYDRIRSLDRTGRLPAHERMKRGER